MKRIVLFVLTNLAILLMLTIIARITGLDLWLARRGSNLATLLALALLFGCAGSLISLAVSKWMAVRTMGIRLIEQPCNPGEQWLIDTVHALAGKAGVSMPAVGVFESPQPNAFATGPGRDRALLAVSSALLSAMAAPEVEAVLGHEITHVANGDMVTLALIQGVVNAFVIVISWIVGNIVDRSLLRDNDGRGIGYLASMWVTQIVLGILATILVMWFSRRRELRADAGGARLTGRERMIGALLQLERAHGQPLPVHMEAFGVSGRSRGGWARLFMSHPSLQERIAALRYVQGLPA